ncbi:hypothetical protein ACFWUP_16540 [Nocardia sp. NPDC058658]|uniref:hypothetical protein n=1 Tax=Nocardia sp. NPDC058658 TaxID=3346580 RepID=UPI0036526A45
MNRWNQYGLPLLLALCSTLLVTVMGLVAEDLLPATLAQIIVFFALLALFLLVALLQLRYLWRRNTSGTLYYLRADSSRVPSLHGAAISAAAEQTQDLCAVRRTFSTATSDGAVDLRGIVGEVRAIFDAALNADSSDSGYSVVPDFAWPVAVSIGYDWLPRPGTWLVAVDEGGPPAAFSYPATGTHSAAPFAPLPQLRHAAMVHGAPVLLPDGPTEDAAAQRIRLLIAVSEGDMAEVVAATSSAGRRLTATELADTGGRAPVFAVGYGATADEPTLDLRGDGNGGHDLRAAADQLTQAIRLYLDRFPNAHIELVLDAPDILSLAIGWRLANPDDAGMRSRIWEFWDRVVPLYGDIGPDREPRVVALWVHPAQAEPSLR